MVCLHARGTRLGWIWEEATPPASLPWAICPGLNCKRKYFSKYVCQGFPPSAIQQPSLLHQTSFLFVFLSLPPPPPITGCILSLIFEVSVCICLSCFRKSQVFLHDWEGDHIMLASKISLIPSVFSLSRWSRDVPFISAVLFVSPVFKYTSHTV